MSSHHKTIHSPAHTHSAFSPVTVDEPPVLLAEAVSSLCARSHHLLTKIIAPEILPSLLCHAGSYRSFQVEKYMPFFLPLKSKTSKKHTHTHINTHNTHTCTHPLLAPLRAKFCFISPPLIRMP